MRITSWNCNGGFKNKFERVAEFDDDYGDDILVIQESENPKLLPARLLERYPNVIWEPASRDKGLLFLASERYQIANAQDYDETYSMVIPILVTGESEFTLIGVWGQKSETLWYTDYVLSALKYYESLIEEDTIVVGDFNSTPKVRRPRKGGVDHADLVSWLEEHGLVSAYHVMHGEAHGDETMGTYAHRRDLSKPFHLDYLFASERALSGSAAWITMSETDMALSDHIPLFVSPEIRRVGDVEG